MRVAVGVAIAGSWLLSAQETPKPGARDMFFGGFEDPVPAKRNTSPSVRKPEAAKRTTPASVSGPRAGSTTGPKVPLVQANHRPLGLRYSLLQSKGADWIEVPQNTEFNSGDRIRLRLRANEDGYLYVVNQGTSGNWSVLYPKPGAASEPQHVSANQDYDLPSNTSFRFTGTPGTERLFIVLTRVPEQDFDKIIFGVKEKPAAAPSPAQGGEMLLAENRMVGNAAINRLRSATRDLVLEDAQTEPAASRDFGVYVVNPTASQDARVVADILLGHK